MRKYNVFDLDVVKTARRDGTYQYFICKYNMFSDTYVEIFTNMK